MSPRPMQQLGIPHLEHCNSHRMGGGQNWNVTYTMSDEERAIAKAALEQYGISMLSYGVVNHKYTRQQWRQVFAYAKDMGIETVMAEPAYEDLVYVDSLAQEFGVRMAIHNHPKPTLYWSPDIVKKYLPKLSEQTGIGPDLGNWFRSDITAIDELPSWEGRIYSIQLKDFIHSKDRKLQVRWGTGTCHLLEILIELKNQGYKGAITMECFNQRGDVVGDIQESIRWFKRTSHEIAQY